MTFDDEHWTMTREHPDIYQRFIADVEKDRILGRWRASDDRGKTWRKDFDLTSNEPDAKRGAQSRIGIIRAGPSVSPSSTAAMIRRGSSGYS